MNLLFLATFPVTLPFLIIHAVVVSYPTERDWVRGKEFLFNSSRTYPRILRPFVSTVNWTAALTSGFSAWVFFVLGIVIWKPQVRDILSGQENLIREIPTRFK